MKNTLVAMMMLLSSAMATAQTDGSYPSYPRFGGFAVTELCDAGSTFRTIKPVPQCTGWKLEQVINDQGVENEWKCLGYKIETKEVSKEYQTSECHRGSRPDCDESIQTHGNSFKMPIYEMAEYGPVQTGSTTYTVPACH